LFVSSLQLLKERVDQDVHADPDQDNVRQNFSSILKVV